MTARLTGRPIHVGQAVISNAKVIDIIWAAGPNRGGSRTVRYCIQARLHPDSGAVP